MNIVKAIFPMPPLASVEGHDVDTLMYLIHFIIVLLFFGWAVFFIITLFKFNYKKHPQVERSKDKKPGGYSTALELVVAVIEVILLLGLSIPFWTKRMTSVPEGSDVMHVRIVGQQFAWNVHYPGPDGRFGRTRPEFLNQNAVGLDLSDPPAKDDIITMNQLYLPVNKTVVIHLSSKDVVHSFSAPLMRVKQDLIPGLSTVVWFTPNKVGHYEIVCAQLCGLGHYAMRGFITVQDQKDYDQWVQSQEETNQQLQSQTALIKTKREGV